jgi:hypothetical protein
VQPGPDLEAAIETISAAAIAAGRDPADVSMEGRVSWHGDLAEAIGAVDSWRNAGATHVSINTMGSGLSSIEEHVAVLAQLADALALT